MTHQSGDGGDADRRLCDLLLVLALDMSALDRFVHEPNDTMTQAGISEEDQRVLLSADPAAINKRLWGDDVPQRGPLLAVEVVATADGPRPLIRGTGTPILAAALQQPTRQTFTTLPGSGALAHPPAAGIMPPSPMTPGAAAMSTLSAWPQAAAPSLPVWTSHPEMPPGGDVGPFGRQDSSFAAQHELPARAVNTRDFDLLVDALNMQPALTATVLLTKAIESAADYPIENQDALSGLFDRAGDGETVTFGNRTVSRRQFEAYADYFAFPIEERAQLMSPLVAIFEAERHRELRKATTPGESEA